MLFSFLKKRLVNTKSFITVLIILNICFAFLLGISFTSVKSKISYERGQSVEALYLSAESNIKLVLEQIRLLGDDASEKLPDFADTSDSFKLNMSEYLKRLDCLYDIIYIYEDDIYSCGKLLTELNIFLKITHLYFSQFAFMIKVLSYKISFFIFLSSFHV